MIRGTTPTLIFGVPFDVTAISLLNITFVQAENIVLEKELEDIRLDQETNEIICALTEEETLILDSEINNVDIQLRVGIGEERLVSNIISTTVERILKDGVLE